MGFRLLRLSLGPGCIGVFLMLLVSVLLVAVCSSCGDGASGKQRRTDESIVRHLSKGGRIKYADFARSVYMDSGWLDENKLESWLWPRGEGEHAYAEFNRRRDDIVWIWEAQAPEEELVALYAIIHWSPMGPRKSWRFFVDVDDYIRAYYIGGEQ
jgi:hypothetical protein